MYMAYIPNQHCLLVIEHSKPLDHLELHLNSIITSFAPSILGEGDRCRYGVTPLCDTEFRLAPELGLLHILASSSKLRTIRTQARNQTDLLLGIDRSRC